MLVLLILWAIQHGIPRWFWGWEYWHVVTAVATCVLAVGVIIAFVQFRFAQRATRRSINAQVAMDLFRELRSSDSIRKLREIYDMDISEDQLKSGEIENKSIEHKIDYILDRYDTLGSLVKHGIVDKDIAIETYAGTSALRFWYRLVTYIKAMRRKRGYYATNFEDYVRKSYNYFQDRNIEVWFYSKCEESVELIGYFTERLGDKEFMPQEI